MCSEHRGDDGLALCLPGSCCPVNTAAESPGGRGDITCPFLPSALSAPPPSKTVKEGTWLGLTRWTKQLVGPAISLKITLNSGKSEKSEISNRRNKIFGRVAKQPSKGVAFLSIWWCRLPKTSKAPWPKW